MHGHGATVVSPQGVEDLVHRGIYKVNGANIPKEATLLSVPTRADVQTLNEGEIDTCGDAINAVGRSWLSWVKALGNDTGLESS